MKTFWPSVRFDGYRTVKNGPTTKSTLGWNIFPYYLRIEDGKTGTLEVEDDGTFTWVLPKGTYLLHQLHWIDNGPNRYEPKLAFQVTNDAHAYCLGTLIIDLKAKRNLTGVIIKRRWRIRVEDHCATLESTFRAVYTDPRLKIKKAVMVHSFLIPDRPERLEKKDIIIDILNALTPGLMTIQ